MPLLELLLAGDGAVHCLEELGMDEPMDAIAGSKARHFAGAMLPDSSGKVRGDADVQCAPRLAGENVSARIAALHNASNAAPWMLKQVQHDGLGVRG
jgi:hypothetical protein